MENNIYNFNTDVKFLVDGENLVLEEGKWYAVLKNKSQLAQLGEDTPFLEMTSRAVQRYQDKGDTYRIILEKGDIIVELSENKVRQFTEQSSNQSKPKKPVSISDMINNAHRNIKENLTNKDIDEQLEILSELNKINKKFDGGK